MVSLADADADAPYDNWTAANVRRPRSDGLRTLAAAYAESDEESMVQGADHARLQADEDELEADEDLFKSLSTPGVVPPGFRYSTSHGKAIPEDMHSSSHSAEKDYLDANGNEIDAQSDAQTGAGDEQPLRSQDKRTHEVLCPNTPPVSPKRARTVDSGGTGVFIPETPTREERESRVAELEQQVKALQERVRELEAGEATRKRQVTSLADIIRQMRERLDQQAQAR